jgi:hypothetical protein
MTNKDKLYAVGSVVCIAAAGTVVFYLIKNNYSTKEVSAVQNNLTQNANSNQNLQTQPSEGQIGNSTVPVAPVADNPITDSSNPSNYNSNANAPDATNSTPSPASNNAQGRSGLMANIPAGSKPIFGQVSSVSGSRIVVTSMSRQGSGAGTDSTTTPTKTTINVTLASSTIFSGGTKDTIVIGTLIFGYGTVNADGSINATNIQINPTMPSSGKFN